MSSRSGGSRNNPGRKRAPKACKRCRDQKIKCSGADPCHQCDKRGLPCYFDQQSEKVLVTRRYISNLHERLASFQSRDTHPASPDTTAGQIASSEPYDDVPSTTDSTLQHYDTISPQSSTRLPLEPPPSRNITEAPLTNPLAFHTTDWVPGRNGKTVFMGTSSNWSFGRRVLTMAHESITGTPLPPDSLLFDSDAYDLKWNGSRRLASHELLSPSALPTEDFALYLINTVKFRCCQLFYLFDDEDFMRQFALYHQDPVAYPDVAPLWYAHYLIVLAFGKAFVVQTTKSQRPPGADLFVQAMKLLPDFTFLDSTVTIDKIQVLCCTALFLQCLNCRPAAYRTISQAICIALEHGMHTEMQSQYLDESYVQRCRMIWWTVYALERQMSSLMGVPMAVADQSISTPLPVFPRNAQKTNATKIQVELSQVLAKIHHTVYGIEGRLDSRYLGATQSVLRSVADVAEHIHTSFDMQPNENRTGMSRTAAHLHLQHHQCIVLTTRPLLYSFLQSRLGQSEVTLMHWLQSDSVKDLLQICIESSRQILRILSGLLNQGLLETFLPFDLDAAFTSTIALHMAATIDPTLVSDYGPWSQRAYTIFDEIISRGNTRAEKMATELKWLEGLLGRLLEKDARSLSVPQNNVQGDVHHGLLDASNNAYAGYPQALDMDLTDDFGLSAEQLMNIANSLDMDSLAWPMPVDEDLGSPGLS